MKPYRLLRHSGFSIIEVLLALLVFMIAAIALTQLIASSAVESRESSMRTAATYLAHQKIEELRNLDYELVETGKDLDESGNPLSIGPNGLPPGIFYRSWEVTENQPVEGTKTVVVTVEWSERGKDYHFTVSTIVGRPFTTSSG
ncbi:MAG: hypothetical protein HRF49_00390 [bacterium]|jgi:type II secretory pathway pseudopilin PulG